MRPQGTDFSDSARHRDSVLCLGSIAALQYYFARTGLLDGKGAQMAKDIKIKRRKSGDEDSDQDANGGHWIMEPPAISTYRHKDPVTEPLPDMPLLRRQLRDALDAAQKALEETIQETKEATLPSPSGEGDPPEPGTQPWFEAQGIHLLDIVTLSIRQARIYYVTHTHPENLYALRPEKQIRSDLYHVLDILKRMASRDFRGGIRSDEREGIISWIQGIHELLSQEEKQEAEEFERRRRQPWRDGEWLGREREREWLFLNSFDLGPEPLPAWESGSEQPSAFLLALSKGLRLISLHNEMVRRSKTPFGKITTFFTDLAKPYRCAENLRFWAKAAELRWEIKLQFDALEVVHGESEEAWLQFDKAVMTWCKGVREELCKEWAGVESISTTAPHSSSMSPDLNVDAV